MLGWLVLLWPLAAHAFRRPNLVRDPDLRLPPPLAQILRRAPPAAAPPPTTPPIPPHLLKLYRRMMAQPDAPAAASALPLATYDSVTSLYPSLNESESLRSSSGSPVQQLRFRLSGLDAGQSAVAAASLRLRCSAHPPRRVRLSLAERVRNHSLLLDSAALTCADASEAVLDLTPAVLRWLRLPSQSGRLELRADSALVSLEPLNDASGRLSALAPTLELYAGQRRTLPPTPPARKARRKRSAAQHAAHRQHRHRTHKRRGGWRRRERERRIRSEWAAEVGRRLCRRQGMVVDIESVGWKDWIIAPSYFEAFSCAGSCPFPVSQRLNSTNHAIVQAMLHSVLPSAVPAPCCVPTRLGSTALLYFNEFGAYFLQNYPDMIVEGCGCR